MRVPLATAATALIALLLLVLPRTFLGAALGALRPDAAPVAAPDAAAALSAGYPAELFRATRARVAAPVFGIGAGPYRHDLALARGTEDGVREGAAVSLPDAGPNPVPTLVGRVDRAGGSSARVATLLDPAWRSAVRVGTTSVDALLVGGLTPRLTLIPKTAAVAAGDVIISVDETLPYGMLVGTVDEVRDSADGVLREATVALPYSLAALRAVDVLADARD